MRLSLGGWNRSWIKETARSTALNNTKDLKRNARRLNWTRMQQFALWKCGRESSSWRRSRRSCWSKRYSPWILKCWSAVKRSRTRRNSAMRSRRSKGSSGRSMMRRCRRLRRKGSKSKKTNSKLIGTSSYFLNKETLWLHLRVGSTKETRRLFSFRKNWMLMIGLTARRSCS